MWALPSLLVGLRLSFTRAWRTVLVTEFLGGIAAGLGLALLQARADPRGSGVRGFAAHGRHLLRYRALVPATARAGSGAQVGAGAVMTRSQRRARWAHVHWIILAVCAFALLATWLWQSVSPADLAHHAAGTAWRFAVAMLAAVLFSVLLIVVFQRRMGESGALVGTLSFLDSIPSLLWLPLLLLLLVPSEQIALLMVAAIGGALPLAIAVAHGISQVDRRLELSAKLLGVSRTSIWFGVMVKAARPAILAGLRSSVYQAARTLVGAEVIIAMGQGLGQLIQHHAQSARIGGIVATAALMGAFVALLDTYLLRRLLDDAELKWRGERGS